MSKIWVLQHTACETLGTIADALEAGGVGLAVRVRGSSEGKPVPAEIGDAGGLIVMGGPMGVYEQDRYPHLKDELRLIESALGVGGAGDFLGVRLGKDSCWPRAAGAQRSVKGPRAESASGCSIRSGYGDTAAADRLWSASPREFMALHWHGDVFALPSGAVNLASSELTANQAFRYAQSAYGVLFHLEMTEAMIAEMAESFGDELHETGKEPSRLFAESAVHCGKLEAIGEAVFNKWARLVHEARAASAPAPQRR